MAQTHPFEKPVIVIGAGIVGLSTAIWLRRLGRDVILIDKGKPGMGATFGNAGLLAQWAILPVNTPSLWREAPKYLLDPNSPLFLQWRKLPSMIPWLAKFMSNATEVKTQNTAQALTGLLGDAVEQHKSLVRGTTLEKWITDSKLSYTYPNEAAFHADQYSWDMKRAAGFTPNLITGAAVQEEEPILGPSVKCLAVLEGQGHITNPGQYLAELATYFTDQGGTCVQAQVTDFEVSHGKIKTVHTDGGSFECDHAVVTAGIWSKDLMEKLGLKITMQAERGYHVIFENPSIVPRNPMMVTKGKFGVNAMDMGLRCAGTVELGDHHSGPSDAPLRLLEKRAKQAFPTLTYSGTKTWLGFRPTLPDSRPVIGEIGKTGVFAGFGHQHVGLTAGPKTGRLIAQMITGQAPNVDISAFDPARYIR